MGVQISSLITDPRMLAAVAALTASWLLRRKRTVNFDQHYVVKPLSKSFKFVGLKTPKPVRLEDVATVVAEMRESFNTGISRPVAKRLEQIAALRRLFEENEGVFVEALQKDLGRPFEEALLYDYMIPLTEIKHFQKHLREWVSPDSQGLNLLTFPCSQALVHEPKGVVLIIGTWNYPIMLCLVPLLGAIAAGNCVVLKPCVVSPHSARLMAELIPRYMDPNVVTVLGHDLSGDRACTAELLKHKFDHIFFTGSPSVGRVIMRGAAEHLTPVTLELGGKNPVFVDASADLDIAAKRSVWGRNMNAGQQCISPDYVLVHKSVVDKFCERAKHWVSTLYGPGTSSKTNGNVGRIVGDKQCERLQGVLATHGGTLICGGEVDTKERYIQPTVLKVSLDSPSMEEETFGPILLVVPVESMDFAIDYVNSKPKPLSLYIFTADNAVAERIIHNTSSGGVTVNGCLYHCAHPDLPFGGVGDSGIGSYHGKATFDIFSHAKPVLKKTVLPDGGLLSDLWFTYPPWNAQKRSILRALFKVL